MTHLLKVGFSLIFVLYYIKMRIIVWLVMIALVSSTFATKLCLMSALTSTQQAQQVVQIPQIYDHPFSCELVFFNVHNNQFQVYISEIPNNVAVISLQIYKEDQKVYDNSIVVNNNKARFPLETQKQQQSYEVIMEFNLTYSVVTENGASSTISEQRKAYMLFCEKGEASYLVKLPNITIAITQLIGLAFILILPWNIQYRKFLPFTFNILTCFIYILTLLIALYLQIIFGNDNNIVYEFQVYFVGMFQLVCLVMYSQDLLMLCLQKNRVAFLIGFAFSLTIMGLDFFVPMVRDAWFLNDVIAVMVAGAFIKFVIIRKIKSAVWALALMWVFCVFREFAKQFGLQKFDQGLGIRIVPLFLQMPTFWQGNQSSITCSAFGSSKIIAFGVILNYCKRVDLYLSTQFYRILISMMAIICVTAELAFNLLFQDLPTIEMTSIILFYPLAVSLMLFFANKRGEWAEVWHGSFYDMAVNRASIPRSVSFEGLEYEFGKDLMINSGENTSSFSQKEPNEIKK